MVKIVDPLVLTSRIVDMDVDVFIVVAMLVQLACSY